MFAPPIVDLNVLLSSAANKPSIDQVERKYSATVVRVKWSQPPGGANVTGYKVLYAGVDTEGSEKLPANVTSFDINTNKTVYLVLVLALSEYLPGRFVWKNMTACKLKLYNSH